VEIIFPTTKSMLRSHHTTTINTKINANTEESCKPEATSCDSPGQGADIRFLMPFDELKDITSLDQIQQAWDETRSHHLSEDEKESELLDEFAATLFGVKQHYSVHCLFKKWQQHGGIKSLLVRKQLNTILPKLACSLGRPRLHAIPKSWGEHKEIFENQARLFCNLCLVQVGRTIQVARQTTRGETNWWNMYVLSTFVEWSPPKSDGISYPKYYARVGEELDFTDTILTLDFDWLKSDGVEYPHYGHWQNLDGVRNGGVVSGTESSQDAAQNEQRMELFRSKHTLAALAMASMDPASPASLLFYGPLRAGKNVLGLIGSFLSTSLCSSKLLENADCRYNSQ